MYRLKKPDQLPSLALAVMQLLAAAHVAETKVFFTPVLTANTRGPEVIVWVW